jgi:hypothetical protein
MKNAWQITTWGEGHIHEPQIIKSTDETGVDRKGLF